MGGVETFTAALAAQLVIGGHVCEVWTQSEAQPLSTRELVDGVTVRRFDFTLPRLRAASLAIFPLQALRTLAQLLWASRKFRPEVLHVHCFSGNGVYAWALSRLIRVPLVISLHGETLMDSNDVFRHSCTLRWGLRRGLRAAHWTTACSDMVLQDAVQNYGAVSERASVVRNAVDQLKAATRPRAPVPQEAFILGLGRLVHKKGFDLLIRALALMNDGPSLVIAGAGPERASLESLAADLRISPRVVMLGSVTSAEAAWLVREAEVLCMPSRIEPFGLVVLEAWRGGTPVVASDRGGPAEYVRHGVDGLLVDPHDSKALALALESVLASPDLAASLVSHATGRLGEFDWERVVGTFLSLYDCADRSGPTPNA